MSSLRLRRLLQRSRHHVALLFALLALAGAVEAHHGVPMDMHGMPAAALCLAVLGVVAIAVAAVGGVLAMRWPRRLDIALPRSQPVAVRGISARAGPPVFLRLRVLRR